MAANRGKSTVGTYGYKERKKDNKEFCKIQIDSPR